MDRGFLFGDGVYEVIPVFGNKAFRVQDHLLRLDKSLRAIHIKKDPAIFLPIIHEVLDRNYSQSEQAIYLQVTRGFSPTRSLPIPEKISLTIFCYCMPLPSESISEKEKGVSAILVDDIRWQCCNIKAIGLLPNILMQQKAKAVGASEAIFVRDGLVLEGTATNLFMVKANKIITPALSDWILSGITRELIIELANSNGIPCVQRDILSDELSTADEIWLTSSVKEILPVVKIDKHKVADGKAGPMWRVMLQLYQQLKKTLANY
jgi:D-alanine transaminase